MEHVADVVFVGGGVIGLSAASLAAQNGLSTIVCDPTPARGATWAAAGMLAPVTEVEHGEERLLELNLASSRLWPAFAADLTRYTGTDIGYRECGTLVVACDLDDRDWARRLFELQRELGLQSEWISVARARELEGGLAPVISGAMLASQDNQVDNRRLAKALLLACAKAGVAMIEQRVVSVDSSGASGGRVSGVTLDNGATIYAPSVVLCAGARSDDICGVPVELEGRVRPIKGQILRLSAARANYGYAHAATGSNFALSRNVRGIVRGSSIYIVPRGNGEVIIGATVEEQGFDETVTAGAIYEMLRDARSVVPGTSELAITEASCGFRPCAPDNCPIVGASSLDGLVVATAHYRNGILLAPITARAVVAILSGKEVDEPVKSFGWNRLEAGAIEGRSK